MLSQVLSRIRPRTVKRVRARDLRDITPQEYELAQACAAKARSLVESRERVVAGRGIDPAFALPDANWRGEAHFFKVYNLVSECDYRVVNRLRWYCQDFTGYRLAEFRPCEGTQVCGPFPEDAGDSVEDPDGGGAWLYGHYLPMRSALPRWAIANPPRVMGETGWLVNRRLVNQDVVGYQERIFLLHKADELRRLLRMRRPAVVEIGGGYGALCYFLSKILTGATYVILDLPEALLFSSIHLAVALPGVRQSFYDGGDTSAFSRPGVVFVPNYLFGDLRDLACDLAVNTLSLSEMSERQVRTYAEGLRRMLGGRGHFFDQNMDNLHLGLLNVKDILPEYFERRSPVDSSPLPEAGRGRADVWSNGATR